MLSETETTSRKAALRGHDIEAVKRDASSLDASGIRVYHREPQLPPCWAGDFRRWIPTGTSFREQMFCERGQEFINPNGFTCMLCADGRWPPASTKVDLRGCDGCGQKMLEATKAVSGLVSRSK